MTVLPTLKASVLAAAARRAEVSPAVAVTPRAWQRRWRASQWRAARGDTAASSSPAVAPRRRPRARSQRLALSAGLALAAVLLGLSLSGIFAGRTQPAWGAELVSFANASPLVLLDQPRWRIDYANEESAQDGELHFTKAPVPADPTAEDNTTDAQLSWYAGTISARSTDRASSADLITSAPVLGTIATVYQYAGGTPGHQDITALWEYDNRVLEFRAQAADIPAFESLLASLRAVDTNTWLSALPPSVVKATDRAAVIASMLQGVPLPPGFDASTITGADLTSDRYQLGAWVAGTVACTWFKLWSDARTTGDTAGVQQAIAAMATAKDWPILQEMSKSGGYPQVLETLAAAMPSGQYYGRALEGDVNSGLGCPERGITLSVPGSNTPGPVAVPAPAQPNG
jgi:hypothetical protein